jgi:hypothetical protein
MSQAAKGVRVAGIGWFGLAGTALAAMVVWQAGVEPARGWEAQVEEDVDGPEPAVPAPATPASGAKQTVTPLPRPGSPAAAILDLDKACRQARRAARDAQRAAEAAKDGDQAAATRGKAEQAKAQAEAAKRKLDQALGAFVAQRLKELDDNSYRVREAGMEQLLAVGRCVLPLLAAAQAGKNSPEVQARLAAILAKLEGLAEDDDGRLRQWASDAKASSEYSNPNWSARQATGKPDTMQAGDCPTAWASKDPDGGIEWLELTYDKPVRPVQVRVRETYNPGAVTKVEAKDDKGQWHTLWEGKDTTKECPGWLSISVNQPAWACRVIKVTIDAASVPGWNEIDAAELVGEPPE